MTDREKSLAGIRDSLGMFFSVTNVKGLRVVDALPDRLDGRIREAVLARKRSSWFDDATGEVCVFGPSINGYNRDFWQAQVVKAAVERFGLERLFSNEATRQAVVGSVARAAGMAGSGAGAMDRWMEGVADGSVKAAPDVWDRMSRALCSVFKLDYNQNVMSWAFRSGVRQRSWEAGRRAVSAGDYSAYDARAVQQLEKGLEGSGGASVKDGCFHFGDASDAYVRLGYPKRDISMRTERFLDMMRQHGVDTAVLGGRDWASLAQDPLAVVRSERMRADGTYSYIAVLDTKVRTKDYGNEYVAMVMDDPARQVDGVLRAEAQGRGGFINVSPFLMTEASLRFLLCNKDRWRYMKASDGPDGTSYEYVRRIRSGAAPSPGDSSGSNAQLLTIANIANDFRNPMSSAKFFHAFGYERDPLRDALDRKARYDAEIASLARPVEPREPRAQADKLTVPFPKDLFSDAERERLQKAGIGCARDIVREGLERLREVAGTDRAVNRAADFLVGMNVYVYPDAKVAGVASGPTDDAVRAHFFDSVLGAASAAPECVDVPRRLSGECLTGADAVHLMASEVVKGSRKTGPFWATRDELADLGCTVGKAEPVPVWNGERPVYLYNVARTDFPKRYPDEYTRLSESAASPDDGMRMAGRYFGSILGRLKDVMIQNVDGLRHWMDGSGSDAFRALREGRSPSLEAVVGGEGMKEMHRRGKAMRMYESVKDVNRKVKEKGRKP
jgi:hypothetical protein